MLARAARRAWRPATASMAWKTRRCGDRLACCKGATVMRGVPACDHGLPPLRRARLSRRLPGRGVREGPADWHRAAPGRSVHRLPVLHPQVPLRRSQVQPREGHRPQVRHVPATAGGGRGAGMRAGLSESGDSHHGRWSRGCGARMPKPTFSCPARPSRGYTLPTTIYKTRKPLPPNLLPADYSPRRRNTPIGRWCSCWC